MLQRLNPASVSAPFSRYSHAVSVPQGYRWLYVSGLAAPELLIEVEGVAARAAEGTS